MSGYAKFRKIYLEISSACNLRCSFCPPTQRREQFMSIQDFTMILERLKGHGSWLYFHLKGEPLLHPELAALLSGAAAQGFEVTLTSNGSLLAGRAAELFAAPNLHRLNISLQSQFWTCPESTAPSGPACLGEGAAAGDHWQALGAFLDRHHEAVRSGAASFDISLRLWNFENGVLSEQMRPAWNFLLDRYPALSGMARDSAGHTTIPLSLPPRGQARQTEDNGILLDEHVYLNRDELFSWPDPALPEINSSGFCYALRNQIGILADGTVVPCCLDGEGRLALGSLLRESLDDILSSPRARAIYNGFSRRELVEPLCRTCGYLHKRMS